ncbi:MAG: transposase [Myxococcota bacterium]|nr:transposase [Myxococcota bacterium]
MGGGKVDGKLIVAGEAFERLMRKSPESLIARAAMENALSADALDALFGATAKEQYTRQLLFSSVVRVTSLVTCRVRASVHAAFKKMKDELGASVQALYEKLSHVEPRVCSALVRHSGERLGAVIHEMGGELPAFLPGHPVRILDGAHLAAVERRLEPLRGSVAGPLPGHTLVVLDPQSMVVTDSIPCQDGHAQERSLTPAILDLVQPGEAWMADRNFCTGRLLFGIVDRHAFPIIRQHATNVSWAPAGKRRGCGRIESGRVYEQEIIVWDGDPTGRLLHFRRITLRLDTPTRDGEREIHILTTIPERDAGAKRIARLYARRWLVETAFQEIEKMLNGEIETIGYPRAALFCFSVALVAYNIISTVKAALRAAHGAKRIQEEVSDYYITEELQATYTGMDVFIEPDEWRPFQHTSPAQLARFLVRVARGVDLEAMRRHPRGPKKPVTPRTRYPTHTHVSIAKLLIETTGKVTP